MPESTRETCPTLGVQWHLGVRGQEKELAMAVHDLPDSSVAAGLAELLAALLDLLLPWLCPSGRSSAKG